MTRKVAKPRNPARTLFPDEAGDPRTIRHKSRKAVTFKGGLSRPAHRWFRLTPSYSPDVVSALLREFGNEDSVVLDPFCGRGTTPIECQQQKVSCVGIEINPLLHFAGRVSLDWSIPALDVSKALSACLERMKGTKPNNNSDLVSYAENLGVQFPMIHNVYRWWRPDVLGELLCLKSAILNSGFKTNLQELLMLAVAGILLDTANITLGRLQLHFVDRSKDEISVTELFQAAVQHMIQDLDTLKGFKKNCEIFNADSTQLDKSIPIKKKSIDLVITSPPYPNRYSYVWNTRPHLYFLDFITEAKQASTIDCATVGGTWGTATSRHMKGVHEYKNSETEPVLHTIVEDIRSKDTLMANYVAMYFDDLCSHIKTISPYLKSGAVCAYVVGNSRIKKSIVDTDTLLQSLFSANGFEPIRLEEIRRRNSGKELHETIVIARK